MDGFKRDGSTGLFVPKEVARQIGLGCPKCDQHFLIPFSHGTGSPVAQKFIRDHQRCRTPFLESLEEVKGQLVCTGQVPMTQAATPS